jgi:transposase
VKKHPVFTNCLFILFDNFKMFVYAYWAKLSKKSKMDFIAGVNRQQMQLSSMEDAISQDNIVRFVDAFVEKLDIEKLGFQVLKLQKEGRPAFDRKVLLKLYFYGYLNGIRSSRRLERECARNIELHWLLEGRRPNYHTIADFRKHNPDALRNTFKLFVLFLKDMDLIGGVTIAIDGTKARAHNSKKNNYNPKKIERHLKRIEEQTQVYLQEMDENDRRESEPKVKNIKEKLERLATQKIRYEQLAHQLEQSGDPQISTTDADARALLVHGQVVEVSYNVQAAVDEQHKLVVATHTINRNDRNALSDIALEAKENMQSEGFTAIADKGYHNGREIETCQNNEITTIVAESVKVNSNEHGTTPDYLVDKFIYNSDDDTYICPQGHTLTTTGTWHKKTRERDSYQFKKYRTPACKTCPVKHLCTGRKDGGREIDRSQYAESVSINKNNYINNPNLYRKRQEINEHIFGTIKRVWGFNYTNLKGLKKVNGEWSLIMTVYNIKRTAKIMGVEELIEKIRSWEPKYPPIKPGKDAYRPNLAAIIDLWAIGNYKMKTAA